MLNPPLSANIRSSAKRKSSGRTGVPSEYRIPRPQLERQCPPAVARLGDRRGEVGNDRGTLRSADALEGDESVVRHGQDRPRFEGVRGRRIDRVERVLSAHEQRSPAVHVGRCERGDPDNLRRRPPTRTAAPATGIDWTCAVVGIDLGDRTPEAVGDPDRPRPGETPAGPSPIGSVAVTMPVVGIDLRKGAVEAVRHPDAAGADRDADRPVADADQPVVVPLPGLDAREAPVVDRQRSRRRSSSAATSGRTVARRSPSQRGLRRGRIDPRDAVVAEVGDPDVRCGRGDSARAVADGDPGDESGRSTDRSWPPRPSLLSTTHRLPSPNAMPVGSPADVDRVDGRLRLRVDLRDVALLCVSVTQMNPPPAVIPPGVPLTGSDPVTVRVDELSVWRPLPG